MPEPWPSPNARAVHISGLWQNHIGDAGALATSRHLARLNRRGNQIGETAQQELRARYREALWLSVEDDTST
jgi:hypothetical protein